MWNRWVEPKRRGDMKWVLEYSNLAIKHVKTPLKALHLVENDNVNTPISTSYKPLQESIKCKSMAYWWIRLVLSVLKKCCKIFTNKRSELTKHVPFTAHIYLQRKTLAIPTRRYTNPFTYKTCWAYPLYKAGSKSSALRFNGCFYLVTPWWIFRTSLKSV